MDNALVRMLLMHAKYSFDAIGWNFNALTKEERDLFGSQATLDRIKDLVEEE
jgi:hypothetical protein